MDFQKRLQEQNTISRGATTASNRRKLLAATHSIGVKDSFWIGTVGILFLISAVSVAMGYGLISYLGFLDGPPVIRIADDRWGTRYDKPSAPITSMVSSGQKVIVGTDDNGLHTYDRTTRLWTSSANSLLSGSTVNWVSKDRHDPDLLWTLTQSGGLAFARGNDDWLTLFGATPFPGIHDMRTAARSSDLIAVGTESFGLGVYDLEQRNWVPVRDRTGLAPSVPNPVRIIREDGDKGVFWAGTEKGLYRLDGADISHGFLADSTGYDVTDVEVGESEILYVTSNKISVGRIDAALNRETLLEPSRMPFAAGEITSAVQNQDALWAGTRSHGVQRYDLKSHRWEPVRIPTGESTYVKSATSLGYNDLTDELYVSSDSGLHVVNRKQATSTGRIDTLQQAGFSNVSRFQTRDNSMFFLSADGKLGVHGGNSEGERSWWQVLSPDDRGDDIATLVDISAVRIDTADISAACQSEEFLYIGTVNGDIVWYHKPTHAWSSINIPLPYAIDELVYNPYTGSTVAISGNALYRSPATLDIFILYLSIPTDDVKVVPTPTGFLIFTDSSTLTHFDENTNRRETLLEDTDIPVPLFKPVSVDRIGSVVYFVTDAGKVLEYDTLRHTWDVPPEIPHSSVVDARGLGYRVVYRTRQNTLHVSGSFRLVGNTPSGLTDDRIRNAASDENLAWVADDSFISIYEKNTHTWRRDRISLGQLGAPTDMASVGGRLAYRTGNAGYGGTLWLEGQRLDGNVGMVSANKSAMYYLKNEGVYQFRDHSIGPRSVVSRLGLRKQAGERLISAAQTPGILWLASNRRMMAYNMTARRWGEISAPDGNRVTDLFNAGTTLYAATTDAMYRRAINTNRWRRISPAASTIRASAVTFTGATLLLDRDRVLHVPLRGTDPPISSIDITPNDLKVPLDLSDILTASQNDEKLTIVTSNHLYRYDVKSHVFEEPYILGTENLKNAVIREGVLWAVTTDDTYVSVSLAGPPRTTQEGTVPEAIEMNLSRDADTVMIDTPLWRWERRDAETAIVLKIQNGMEVPLSETAGTSITRFPFDRIRSLAHDGVDIWLATDVGLVRSPHTSHGDVGRYNLFRPGIPDYVVFVPTPDGTSRLVTRLTGSNRGLAVYNPSTGTWLPTDLEGFDPLVERVLVETPFWRWTASGGSVSVSYTPPVLRNHDVFEQSTDRWSFRFDDIRAVVAADAGPILVSQGIVQSAAERDTSLSLMSMTFSPGPDIPDGALVRGALEGNDGFYLAITAANGMTNLHRGVHSESGYHTEPYSGSSNPFAVKTLIDEGGWRWERHAQTGEIKKYLLAPGDIRQEFGFQNGKFGFDDMRDYTVVGEEVWLATASGIARYPLAASSLPIESLRLDNQIGGHLNPVVTRLNVKDNTLYCELESGQAFKRGLNATDWMPASETEKPWVREPVTTPFWTWSHDLETDNVWGIYRDAKGDSQTVTWSSGHFDFDAISDIDWFDGSVWIASEQGMLAYPRNEAYLDLDSLLVYPNLTDLDGIVNIGKSRPAAEGIYARKSDIVFRFDSENNAWQSLIAPTRPDSSAYPSWQYLTDRFDLSMIVDYDGFWRARRRTSNENPRRIPAVILETTITGSWQPVRLMEGRFEFDIVRDFHVDDQYMWIATRAGLCRYTLDGKWLDLRNMRPLWDTAYTDATDIIQQTQADGDHMIMRRAWNNNTVVDLDLGTMKRTPVRPGNSPFAKTDMITTDYWRWVKSERYRGSVVDEHQVDIELRTVSGEWVALELNDDTGYFPFDLISDMITFDGAVWIATPIGVFRFPAESPFDLSQASFFRADGRLEMARKFFVSRAAASVGRLICETGIGSSRRAYFMDSREQWQRMSERFESESYRFREDAWYWYEKDGHVVIRYEDEGSVTRPVIGGFFSDHYIQSIATDSSSIWFLTPAGIIRYENDASIGRVIEWYRDSDLNGIPPSVRGQVRIDGTGANQLAIHRTEGHLMILSTTGIARFVVEPEGLEFVDFIPLPVEAGSVTSGQIHDEENGAVRLTMDTANGGRVHLMTDADFDVFHQVPVSMAIGKVLVNSQIQSWDSDRDFYWVATKTGLHRIRRDVVSSGTADP